MWHIHKYFCLPFDIQIVSSQAGDMENSKKKYLAIWTSKAVNLDNLSKK